jgi:hypothetical protein
MVERSGKSSQHTTLAVYTACVVVVKMTVKLLWHQLAIKRKVKKANKQYDRKNNTERYVVLSTTIVGSCWSVVESCCWHLVGSGHQRII